MSNAWDEVLDSSGGGSKNKPEFVKFPVGITRLRVLDDVPHVRWTHFMVQHKRSINCPGFDCPICAIRKAQKAAGVPYTQQIAKNFSVNVINRETEKVEILDKGKEFFEELRDFNSTQDLREYDVLVKRKGKTKDDTSYRIDKGEVYPLTDDEKKMKRVDFVEYMKPHTIEQIKRILEGEAWDKVMTTASSEESTNTDEEKAVESDEDVEVE